MAVGIKALSTTAATNATADANINFQENQAPSTLNDSARALMALLAAFYDQIGGSLTVGGSSSAYTITNAAPGTWSAYANGDVIMMKANHTNTGASTINVDSLGVKDIRTSDGGALVAGDMVSGGFYLLSYDSTGGYFQLVNTIAGGSFQPLDATLSAIAALVFSGTNAFLRGTGTDTFVAESASAHRTALGVAIGSDVQAYHAILAGLAGLTLVADNMIYATGASAFSPFATTSAGRAFLNYSDPGADRGIFWDESANALTNFTLGTGLAFSGTELQLQTHLQSISQLSATDNGVIIGNGTNFVLETGATLLTSLGLGTGDSPQFTGLNLGHASDTTLTRVSAGVVAIEGVNILTTATGAQLASANTFTASQTIDRSGGSAIGSLRVLGGGSGFAHAAVTVQTDTDGRGAGYKIWDNGNDVEWALAIPYNISGGGQMRLMRRTSVTSFAADNATFDPSSATTIVTYFNDGIQARITVSSETGGSLTAESSNKQVNLASDPTIQASIHTANDRMVLYAGASARTITQGAGGTQRLHGSSTTGNLTLAARGEAIIKFVSATEWVVMGDVS